MPFVCCCHCSQRARTTLEDFSLSYLPYLGLSPVKDFFRHLDVLVWLEASVYQLDEHNELLARSGNTEPAAQLLGASCIRRALQGLGLLDERVEQEISDVRANWGDERACMHMCMPWASRGKQYGWLLLLFRAPSASIQGSTAT